MLGTAPAGQWGLRCGHGCGAGRVDFKETLQMSPFQHELPVTLAWREISPRAGGAKGEISGTNSSRARRAPPPPASGGFAQKSQSTGKSHMGQIPMNGSAFLWPTWARLPPSTSPAPQSSSFDISDPSIHFAPFPSVRVRGVNPAVMRSRNIWEQSLPSLSKRLNGDARTFESPVAFLFGILLKELLSDVLCEYRIAL